MIHPKPQRGIRQSHVAQCGRHVTPNRRARPKVHDIAGRSWTDGIVLDLSGLRDISLSGNGIATIGAGAPLAQV